jgi:cysteinyl-tRNA synthetase
MVSKLELQNLHRHSFAYVLQAENLGSTPIVVADKISQANRDWVVLDPHFTEDVVWQRADLERIRAGNPKRKIIAYISIGEAENYRDYWKSTWLKDNKLTPASPVWLLKENPEWKGNYVVKYWNPDWQKIILESVKQAMTMGFDGVYLDIVDGFEAFEEGTDYVENRINPESKQSYRRDMVDWVKRIAAQARQTKPDALVIPQNGSALLSFDDFQKTINGVGIEDLFTNGDKKQPHKASGEVLDNLQTIIAAKKPVLLIEYPQKPELQEYVKKRPTTKASFYS